MLGVGISEFKPILVYTVSSRTQRVTQRTRVLKTQSKTITHPPYFNVHMGVFAGGYDVVPPEARRGS